MHPPQGCLPFDLSQAKSGHPCRTRSGSPLKFLAHVPEARPDSRVLLLHERDALGYHEDGRFRDDEYDSGLDAFLVEKPVRTLYSAILPDDNIASTLMVSPEAVREFYGPAYPVAKVEWSTL